MTDPASRPSPAARALSRHSLESRKPVVPVMPDIPGHARQLDTGWRTVAAHTARLGLSVSGLAGLLTLFHTALTINPPIPVPIHPPTYLDGHLAMVAATAPPDPKPSGANEGPGVWSG